MSLAKTNLIVDKSYEYTQKIVFIYKQLISEKKEYVLSKQLMQSGTSVGAIVRGAIVSHSKKEYIV